MGSQRLLAWAMAAGVAACGSDNPSGTSPGTDAGVVVDARADAAGECNGLALAGPAVVVSEQIGATPVGAGGPLAEGTYVTTAEVHYRASASEPTSSLSNLRETVRVTSATADGAIGALVFEPNGNDAETQRVALALRTRGASIAFHVTCPLVTDDTTFDTYTATASTIMLFSSSRHLAVTLTRQP